MRGRDMSPRKLPYSSGESESSYRMDNRSVSPRSSYMNQDDQDDISLTRYRSPRMQRGGDPGRNYSNNSVSDRARSLSPRATRYSSSENVSNLRSRFEKHPQNQGSFISPPDMSAPRSIIGHFVKLKSSVEESVHSEVIDDEEDDEEVEDKFKESHNASFDSRSMGGGSRRSPGYIPTHDYASWRNQSPTRSPSRRDSRSRSPRSTRSVSPRATDRGGFQFPSAHLLPAAPPKKKLEMKPPPSQAKPAPPPPQKHEEPRHHAFDRNEGEVAVASSDPRERPYQQQQQQQQPLYHHVPQHQHHLQSTRSTSGSPPHHDDHHQHHHSTFERMVDETERNYKQKQEHQAKVSVYSPSKSSDQVDLYNKTKPHHYAVNAVKDSIQRKTLTVENQAEVHYEKADAFKREEIRRAKADAASKEMRKMKIDLTVNSAVKAALERVQAERKLAEISQPMQKYKSRSAVKAATSSSLTSAYSPEHGFTRRSLSDEDVTSESSTMTFEANLVNRRTKGRHVGYDEEPISPRSSATRSPDNYVSRALTKSPARSSSPGPLSAYSPAAVASASKYSPQSSYSQNSVVSQTIKNASHVKYQTSPGYTSPLRERGSSGDNGSAEPGLAIVLSASRSAIKAQHDHEIGTLTREYEAKLKAAENKVHEKYGTIQEKIESMEAEHTAKIKQLTESQDNALESLALESVALLSSESEKVSQAETRLADLEAKLNESLSIQEKNKVEYDATVEALTRKSAARFAQYEDKIKAIEKNLHSADHQLSQTSNLHSDEINHLENKVSKLTETNLKLDETNHELEAKLEELNKKLKIAEITIKHSANEQESKIAKLEKEHKFAMAKLTNDLTLNKPMVDEDVLTEQEQLMITAHKEKVKMMQEIHERELKEKYESQVEALGIDFVQLEKEKKEKEISDLKAEVLTLKAFHEKQVLEFETKIKKLGSEHEDTVSNHEYEILELNKMLQGYESEKKALELKLKEAMEAISATAATTAANATATEEVAQLQNEIKELRESQEKTVRDLEMKHSKDMKELEKKQSETTKDAVASATATATTSSNKKMSEEVAQLQNEIKELRESQEKTVRDLETKHATKIKELEKKLSEERSSNSPYKAQSKQSKSTSPASAKLQQKTSASSLSSFMASVPPSNTPHVPVEVPKVADAKISPSTPPPDSPSPVNSPVKATTPTPTANVPPPVLTKTNSLSDFMKRTPSQKFPTSPSKPAPISSAPISTNETTPKEEKTTGLGVSQLSAMFDKSK